MKTLSIQAVEDENGVLHKTLIEDNLQELGFSPEVKESFDDEHYVNFYIDTDDLVAVWKAIKSNFVPVKEIANSCMIICQGEYGWDDFLILSHSSPEIELDEI